MRTMVYESGDLKVTLRRPNFKTFTGIIRKVSVLLDFPFENSVSLPEFGEIVQALVEEDISDILPELDYQEAANLWDAAIDHAGFKDFLKKENDAYFHRRVAQIEHETMMQSITVNAMKKAGLLSADFTLTSALDPKRLEGLLAGAKPAPTPPADDDSPPTTAQES